MKPQNNGADGNRQFSLLSRHKIWLCMFFSLMLSGVLFARARDTATGPDEQACADLAGANKAPWSVTSAEFVRPPFTTSVRVGSPNKVTVAVQFCRVIGTVKPTPESDIQFELWLPRREDWNGKFEGVGSGGTRGSIEYQPLTGALVRGYATVSTDSGHQSTSGYDVSWAIGQSERVIDFGYRAQHTVTQAARALTEQFYGRAPRHSYFVGCSQGGHHALMEAQRYPEDYDGIVAGAPGYNFTGEMTGQAWNVQALRQVPQGALQKEKLALLFQAVVTACAGVDGLIEDPRRCSFDPETIECKSADSASCLTPEEVGAVRKLYDGPRTSAGAQIYPGLARGGEGDWSRLWSDPKHLGGSWEGFYRYMLFDNPAWDLAMMNFDRDPVLAKKKLGAILDSDSPDLAAFARRGGKLIVYHGWGDDMVPSQVSIDYRDLLRRKMGESQANKFFRLFMIPGMAHCGGGPGADVLFHSEKANAVPLEPERDMLTALEQWVEQGRAPFKFVASRVNEQGAVERTRLICAYPSQAKYRGQGDVARAENFACSTK
jgi:pimeloyl-ACP methyl ester carboxylesterase